MGFALDPVLFTIMSSYTRNDSTVKAIDLALDVLVPAAKTHRHAM